MSSTYTKFNNFLNKEKGNISNFTSGVNYSKNNNNTLNSFGTSYNLNKTKIYNLNNNNINNFTYREDYIPKKINYNNNFSLENSTNNLLGHKLNRTNETKIQLPNDKRYHKTLLQTSLEKIRNEIKQKRLENTIRMNELNNRTDYLNDYFKNYNNNTGKYAGIFSNKIDIVNTNKFNNNNIDLQEKEINKNIINTNLKKNKVFDNDLICNDINESFTIFANKRKKIEPQSLFIQQRQNEFTYNNKSYNNNNNSKISLGSQSTPTYNAPLSSNISFGFSTNDKDIKIKEKSLFGNAEKEGNKNTSLFGFNEKNKNNITDENKNKNIVGKTENKILFGAPKEN